MINDNPHRPEGVNLGAQLPGFNQQQIDEVLRAVPGGSANVQDVYPLSPLQEGMLFHHILNPRRDTYIMSTLFAAPTRAEVDALIGALQKVVDRHPTLRTAVLWERLPMPVQVVYRHAQVTVGQLESDRYSDPCAELHSRMKPGRDGLTLQRAPLMRLTVAADGQRQQWYALLQIHHVVCDYQSWNTVISETMTCLDGREQDLPPAASYRQYIEWAAADGQPQVAEEFFRRKLGDVDEPTAPFGLLDLYENGAQMAEATVVLQPGIAKTIRSHARQLAMSPARLFHAAWALVVARTSGRDDVVFGTALMSSQWRNDRAQRMVGMSVNTLPLRVHLRDATTRQFVEHTKRELDDLLNHGRVPLSLAQSCSGVHGGTPLFTTLLNYRRGVTHENATAGGGIRVAGSGEAWTNYPIALTVDDMGEQFLLHAQCDSRVDPNRVTAYMETALRSIMDALQNAPQTPVLSLSVVPEAERSTMVASFNATQTRYLGPTLIHQLVEEQVARTPAFLAVVHGGQSLTYADLNLRSNQLAHYLRRRGVGPDRLVGVCAERCCDMIVAVLAIMKAGAAYVPIDPSYPRERVQYMVADAAPALVLTQQRLLHLLADTGVDVVPLDTFEQQVAAESTDNPSPEEFGLNAEHLLYVIYTSGSTGRPKGIAMPHGAMSNLLVWQRRYLQSDAPPRVLQFAALSFDVAFQEIFSTLTSGGTLVLLDEWLRRDARALLMLLEERQIDRLFLPPLMLQSLAEEAQVTNLRPSSLRDVITAGEQLRISSEIVAFFNRLDRCRLHNHYGPTETHVVTALSLEGEPGEWPALPTIGRPIANTQIYILDEGLQPAPLGVGGEIYIAGANLARGYLNRQELTAARFLPNVFSVDARSRMYRTGDLGHWCSDGTIEYLGRNDDQVKIRGFRIELGEIEAELTRHEEIGQAAVCVHEVAPGDKLLVAYVTAGKRRPSPEELREYLKTRLPGHMVPHAFVTVPCLPLTPSGKLDRRALPAPDGSAFAATEYEAPRGELENELASIWRELLRVKRIGRHDNFFELGGHSLHGIKVVALVEHRFAVRLSIVAIFERPTVYELAAVVDKLRSRQAGALQEETISLDAIEFEQGMLMVADADIHQIDSVAGAGRQ